MNEITRIHLDRQAFTISVEAHQALKQYLAAIKKQVGSKGDEVLKEVELRMAELLSEHGIDSGKTILMEDIDFLKEQLGTPKDFKEDADDVQQPDSGEQAAKRLFRDPDNGMLAGVAAGLANYFGIDVSLVRILFIATVLLGGWGILVYILLWLLVPEAKTSSDRLQMRGLAVTVDSLKEVVDRADLQGAAKRANGVVAPFINSFFKAILRITGVGFIVTGLTILFASIAVGIYVALHGGKLFQENIFPVGSSEVLLVIIGVALTGLLAVFAVLCGMAMFRRKWPIKVWITGTLIGIFFVGSAVGIALAADAIPRVHDRYMASVHTTTRNLPAFASIDAKDSSLNIQYQHADNYSVKIEYLDNPDLSQIKTDVVNNQLVINSQQFSDSRKCNMLCLYRDYRVKITVYGPTVSDQNFVKQTPELPAKPSPPVAPAGPAKPKMIQS